MPRRQAAVRLSGGVVVALTIALMFGAVHVRVGGLPVAVCYAQEPCDPGDEECIRGTGCVQICQWVAQGQMAWWDALLFGCWCDGQNANTQAPPVLLGGILLSGLDAAVPGGR